LHGNRIPGIQSPMLSPLISVINRNSNQTSTFSVINGGDGKILVKMTPTISGMYTLDVSLSGVSVAGTPAVLQVSASSVEAKSSTSQGITTTAIAGNMINVQALARDSFGNLIEGGAVQTFKAVFSSEKHAISAPMRREGETATYSADVFLTVAGSYSLAIMLGNSHVKDSPFAMRVSAGAVHAGACFASGSAVMFALAGDASSFSVFVRDKYLNYIQNRAVLETGFTATLTSWAVPDPSRAGLHVFHTECKGKLTCPLTPKSSIQAATRNNELNGITNGSNTEGTEGTVKQVVVQVVAVVNQASDGSVGMNFAPIMPGVYFLYVAYFGVPIAKALGGSCSDDCLSDVCTSCPTVGPAPAPVVERGIFQDHGGQVTVDLLQDSNRADQRGIFDCNVLLTIQTISLLGSPGNPPKCTFKDPQSLLILLGFGATIQVNQEIEFSVHEPASSESIPVIGSGGIRGKSRCESPYALSYNASQRSTPSFQPPPSVLCFQTTKATSGPVRVLRPANPVKPTAILKGPSLLGPCDKLELDASSSYGSGGRALQYQLGLKPSQSPGSDDALRAFLVPLSSLPFKQQSWTIDPSLLLQGVPVTFVVRVTNFLQESSLSDMTVLKRSFTAPIIMIEGPQTRQVLSTEIVRLRGDVMLSACAAENDKSVEFEWSLISQSPGLGGFGAPLELDVVTRGTRSLYIAAGQLQPGHNYTFQLTGRMKENQTNLGAEQVVIACKYAELVAKIHGSDRAVHWGDVLELDASASLDLDGAPQRGTPVWLIDYSWACFTANGDACFEAGNRAMISAAAVLEIDTLTLSPGLYTFEVSLLKEPGPRQASTNVRILIMPDMEYQVAISPLAVRKVNPGERLTLQGAITAAGLGYHHSDAPVDASGGSGDISNMLSVAWTQVAGEHIIKYPEMIATPPKLLSLAIRQGVLAAGQAYRFRLTVVTTKRPDKAQGFAEIGFVVNSPPSSGRCLCSPSRGHITTNFALVCQDWVDEAVDLPLIYQFRYILPTEPDDEIPLGTLDKNIFTTRLPAPPLEKPEHKVVVVVYVTDQAGGGARTTVDVQVSDRSAGLGGGAGRRLLQVQDLAKLDECVATGDVECIIQLTLAVAASGKAGVLLCSDKSGMIERLRNAAALLRMNSVQVTGFATAIKAASSVACLSAAGTRRTMASAEVGGSLDLVSSLVSTSQKVGLEGLASKGMGHSLSTVLQGMATINEARRSVRSALRSRYPHAAASLHTVYLPDKDSAEHSSFMRRGLSLVEYQWKLDDFRGRQENVWGREGRGEWRERRGTGSSAHVLMSTLSSLSASQLGAAVAGQDSAKIESEFIAMSSSRLNPGDLDGASFSPSGSAEGPSFLLPRGISSVSRRSSAGKAPVDVQSSGLGASPFDADAEIGGDLASLALGGTAVAGLYEPILIEMPGARNGSGSTQLFTPDGKLWDAFDGKVDTCQYWNFALGVWDASGCIAVRTDALSGKLHCHCYHLTDFGGVASDVMPKMSMPDPTNPAAVFKSFSADDITVVAVLAAMLLTYLALVYWGWQTDREEARKHAAGLLKHDPHAYRRSQEEEKAEEIRTAINTNNAFLTNSLMRGSLLQKLSSVRRELFNAVSRKHKLLGGFFCEVNSNYTRPRRFTVLFCMIIGNMFVNALWVGSGSQQTFIQKALGGVISALIMFPASVFFAWIFKTLEISPERQRVRDERVMRAKAYQVQRMVNALGVGTAELGPGGVAIAGPPHTIKHRPPKRRNWVPAPDFQRISQNAVPSESNRFKRKSTANSAAKCDTDLLHGSQFLQTLPSPVQPGVASVISTSSAIFAPTDNLDTDTGVRVMIQRRSLPMHKGPHRPAPLPLKQLDRHGTIHASESSSDDENKASLSSQPQHSESAMSFTHSNVARHEHAPSSFGNIGGLHQGPSPALPHVLPRADFVDWDHQGNDTVFKGKNDVSNALSKTSTANSTKVTNCISRIVSLAAKHTGPL
jgi:hypothetical protein